MTTKALTRKQIRLIQRVVKVLAEVERKIIEALDGPATKPPPESSEPTA